MGPHNVLKRYATQINEHKFSAVEGLISDGAIFWFSSGTFRGKKQIQAAFEKTWSIIQNEVYWLTDIEWIASDETSAVCVYTFHWKGIVGSQEKEGLGRGTSIIRREDGNWRIVHEHLSSFPS